MRCYRRHQYARHLRSDNLPLRRRSLSLTSSISLSALTVNAGKRRSGQGSVLLSVKQIPWHTLVHHHQDYQERGLLPCHDTRN